MNRREEARRRLRALPLAAAALAAAGCAFGGDPGRAHYDESAGYLDPATLPNAAASAPSLPSAPQASMSMRQVSESHEFQPETGPFVGASYVVATIGGDFDGNSTFLSTGGNERAIVPKISTGDGGRVAAGWRWTRGAVEFAFQETRHDGEFRGTSGFDVTSYSAEIDGRFYLPSFWDRLKPSIVAGIVIPWLDVHNGASGTNVFGQPETGTATYYGTGFQIGLGAELYLTRHWSLDLLGAYRWLDFDSLSGIHTDSTLDHDIWGNGWLVGIGTSWTF